MIWKKNPRFEPITPEQKLGYLVEEVGEVLAALGKTLRWGPDSRNPMQVLGETNREWLLREMCDLEDSIGYAREALGEHPRAEEPNIHVELDPPDEI